MHLVPGNWGDTLWASGYKLYNPLKKQDQRALEKVTAAYDKVIVTRVVSESMG